jgi:hypothetical protein
MQVTINKSIVDALKKVHDIPDVLQHRFDAIAEAGNGSYTLKLTEDEAIALTELAQWHIRSDDAGKCTPETAPYAELIRRVDAAQFG